MTENMKKAIELALTEFKLEYGEDSKIEEGESFITIFNDCILIVTNEDGTLDVEFNMNKAFTVGFDVFEQEEGADNE